MRSERSCEHSRATQCRHFKNTGRHGLEYNYSQIEDSASRRRLASWASRSRFSRNVFAKRTAKCCGMRYIQAHMQLSSQNWSNPLAAIGAMTPFVRRASSRWTASRAHLATFCLLHAMIVLVCSPIANAHALLPQTSSMDLYKRQAIPDQTGNTGNVPAAVRPAPPPRPPTISTLTTTITMTASSTILPTLLSSVTARPTLSPPSSPIGDSNPSHPGSTFPPAEELKLTRTNPVLSHGTLARIITGSTVLLLIVFILMFVLIRRKRRPEIAEIPIRRSKLGSILRHRMFNSPLPSSRRSSDSFGSTLAGDLREDWLQKDTIGRPIPHKGEDDFLSVPQPAFMRDERKDIDYGEKWVDKTTISAPRPGRPASAEPLGRLSGMGLGMGYLK